MRFLEGLQEDEQKQHRHGEHHDEVPPSACRPWPQELDGQLCCRATWAYAGDPSARNGRRLDPAQADDNNPQPVLVGNSDAVREALEGRRRRHQRES